MLEGADRVLAVGDVVAEPVDAPVVQVGVLAKCGLEPLVLSLQRLNLAGNSGVGGPRRADEATELLDVDVVGVLVEPRLVAVAVLL